MYAIISVPIQQPSSHAQNASLMISKRITYKTAPIQEKISSREKTKPDRMKTLALHTANFFYANQDFTHDLVTQLVKLLLMEIMTYVMPGKLPMDLNVPVKLPLNAAPRPNFSMSLSSLSSLKRREPHCPS